MPAKVAEVAPGIYEIFLPLPMRPTIVNVYLIDCHGAWALVDTGMNTADSFATLNEAFEEVGLQMKDLDVVIGTHHHVDHFGTSATIKKHSNATTLLHQLEQERVNRMLTLGPPSANPDAHGIFSDSWFSG